MGPQILRVDREAMGFGLQTSFEPSGIDDVLTSLSKERLPFQTGIFQTRTFGGS